MNNYTPKQLKEQIIMKELVIDELIREKGIQKEILTERDEEIVDLKIQVEELREQIEELAK